MQSDTCVELLEAVRQALDYLFADFGFLVTAVKPASTDGRCLIVLSSEQCRFRIIFNRGDLEIAVGSLSSPVSWEDTIAGYRQWYYLRNALDYVRGDKYPALDSPGKPFSFPTLEQKLTQAASDLRPDCWKVLQLFREDMFDIKQRELLDEFLHEQNRHIRKQLEEWLRKQNGQPESPNT